MSFNFGRRAAMAMIAGLILAGCGGGDNPIENVVDKWVGISGNVIKDKYERDERSGRYQAITADGDWAQIDVQLNDYSFRYGRDRLGSPGELYDEDGFKFRYELMHPRSPSSRIVLPKGELVGALNVGDGRRSLVIGTEKFLTSINDVKGTYSVLSRSCEGGVCRGAVSTVEVFPDGTFTSQHIAGDAPLLPSAGRLDNRSRDQVFDLRDPSGDTAFGALRFMSQAGGYSVLVASPTHLNGSVRVFAVGMRQGESQERTQYWRGWDNAGLSREASFSGNHAKVGPFSGSLDRHAGAPGLLKVHAQGEPVFAVKNDRLFAALRPSDGYLMIGAEQVSAKVYNPDRVARPEQVVRH